MGGEAMRSTSEACPLLDVHVLRCPVQSIPGLTDPGD